MKNRVYFQIYKMNIVRSMAYKFEVYGNILIQTIIMLSGAFFWKALLKSGGNVRGIDVDTMLTYTVVSSMISVVLTTNVERRLNLSVQKGTIAIDFMRPVDLYRVLFAENMANVTSLIFQNLIPVFVIGCVLVGVPVPSSAGNLLLFFLSLLMAFLLNWFLALLFGMWSFWLINIDALLQVKKHLIRLLSGSIIPIWFFPDWLKRMMEFLPFPYLYQLPLDLYIGRADGNAAFKGLLVQLLWLVVLIIVFEMLKRRVAQKVMVQGG